MFKKLKDKLAEEVKSSPQRIQLFAQAAQAAVTSASSSISDITNSDLFSIGENDGQQAQQPHQNRPPSSPAAQHKMFQDVSLMQSPTESMDLSQEIGDSSQRQRRLSNSSFASDVSFRLPSYETPSMYHLQSDMEVSASEAEERGFSGGAVTLDRVTKEQLYAAYKRTHERYKKYRTQYGDLARHYKLLERENAKARSVLVETQDKALRRISELKEQCSLEQSAKAHLEKALRVEIEEKSMKIEALNTKIQCLQNNTSNDVENNDTNANKPVDNDVPLISLDNDTPPRNEETTTDTSSLTNKIEKMEQLLNKYKESLKTSKEKNSQINTELQILSKELENKNKQILELKVFEEQLNEAKTKIQELNNVNEELQNQVNSYEFQKTKEQSTLELDLQKANDEIAELRSKIKVFTKREEENAISLAENKLSIHKELESKEAEIKSLKDIVSVSKNEIQSLKIVVDEYKNKISALDEEKIKLGKECAELATLKSKIIEMDTKMQELSKKSLSLEQLKSKADEEYKCLQLQLKQETAEKLAMIDRNAYLETKNTQLTEENSKKNAKISNLESQLQVLNDTDKDIALKENEKLQLLEEMNMWKEKCTKLEQEIQEEREELVKLQTEIEKLLTNHELIQTQNAEFRSKLTKISSEYSKQNDEIVQYKTSLQSAMMKVLGEVKHLKESVSTVSNEAKTSLQTNKETMSSITENIKIGIKNSISGLLNDIDLATTKYNTIKSDYNKLQTVVANSNAETSEHSNRYENLRIENDNLKTKLYENEAQIKTIKSQLDDKNREYDEIVERSKLLSNEIVQLNNKISECEITYKEIQANLESEKAQHATTAEKLQVSEIDKQNINDTLQSLESQNKVYVEEIDKLKQQHEDIIHEMKVNYDVLLHKKEEAIANMSQNEQQHVNLLEKIEQLQTEKNKLHNDLSSLEVKNQKLLSDIDDLNKKHEEAIAKVKELNIEIDNKTKTLQKSEEDQITLEKEVAQYAIAQDTASQLEKMKQNLIEKLENMEHKNKQLNLELEDMRSKFETAEAQTRKVNIVLNERTSESKDKQAHISDLEKQIQHLTQENISLKSETTNFASNIEKLETEIEDIKISHAEIETEKDHLNTIIEELERNQKEKEDNKLLTSDMDSQTESQQDTGAVLENKWIKEHQQTLTTTASLNLNKENLDDLYEQYSTLKINHDSLKDENRRLLSDIEGLQSYLTKISKENSVLNDKLRELIATSEHSTDADQLSTDVKELRNEVQISKDKLNDLQRENTLLIEENFELKDQLQSQNYSKPVDNKTTFNDKDLDVIKVKYNDLLHAHSDLEKQNMDLEQMNKSVNGNMQQLQEKNERLRLSNEKLERRLDEALVSLRHLHSLQENTELEYLRNILYEYLTGSGTHSVTLAKVLAAIVKFDDGQTQLVLQKERERQGFLRQLGII